MASRPLVGVFPLSEVFVQRFDQLSELDVAPETPIVGIDFQIGLELVLSSSGRYECGRKVSVKKPLPITITYFFTSLKSASLR